MWRSASRAVCRPLWRARRQRSSTWTLQDVSIPRAEDVINTLISVYNTDAINDKNQIVMNTSNFINDRLIVIEKELGMWIRTSSRISGNTS